MKSILCIFLLVVGCGAAVGLTKEYIYNKTHLRWDDAQSSCKQYYKDLATITTMEENNQALQSGSGPVNSWIGLENSQICIMTSTCNWSGGEALSFVNWFSGEYTDWYYCAALSQQGFWESCDCDDSRSFYCYRYLILVQEKMTWDEAREYCRTYYTGLASVTSETSLWQLNLETAQTQTESVWTGLSFMNGIWFWVSGEQLGSLVSLSSCPPPSHRCGSLDTTTNTLENRNCSDMLNFVCYLK